MIKKMIFTYVTQGVNINMSTTDVTRTICLTKQPQRIKNVFTKGPKGPRGCSNNQYLIKDYTGASKLDKRARKYLE